MLRFPGLDGLRGWLAWMVVLDHVAVFTHLGQPWVSQDAAQLVGRLAVMIFIILSGFVIAHLVVEQDEPYRLYLARRTLRIYPIYMLALIVSIGTTFLTFRTFLLPDGTVDPAAMAILRYPEPGVLQFDWAALRTNAYFAHLALHLTMMHGVFAQSFLPNSEFMFLSPAWSLSLEFQFYLVAPFVIRAAARKFGSIGMVLLTLLLFVLYSLKLFGWWGLPSFLPGASLFFAVGIASRLLITGKPWRLSAWPAASVALLATGFLVAGEWRLPVVVWIVFLAALRIGAGRGRFSGPIGRVFEVLFDSRLATHLGKASYSTYLLHFPLLQLAMYVAVRILALTPTAAAFFVAAGTLLSTWALSQATYRFIERPFIQRGKRLRDPAAQAAGASSLTPGPRA